jgi:GntR family transcriptional regulator/MocR family aminotransferase
MARARTSSPLELLVVLRRDDAQPLHSQLEHGLRDAIRTGRLTAGSALPSTRVLADQLELSRGVAVVANEQLIAEGYLDSRPGGSTRVSARVAKAQPRAAVDTARPSRIDHRNDFSYGRPDVTQFPRAMWLRSLRRVLNEAPSERLGYLEGRGAAELRDALATYLNRVRGTAANAERMVVCNGFAQAVALVLELIRDLGCRRVAVEEPGQIDTLPAAKRVGLTTVPIPVDEDGIVVEALERTEADAVLVTPAHHFPTGAVLSPDRRAALVAWASTGERLIIEDDYDAEFRYDREPIGAIQGLAPDRVIYAGSASKTLAPGLRLGWLVLPGHVVEQVAATKEAIDRGSASLEQLAFADFLSRGEFDHHLRRMRPIYRSRRDALLEALRQHLPELQPVGASAGLHLMAWLPAGVAEAAVVERAARAGVGVYGLSRYFSAPMEGRGALLFGYGPLTEEAIHEGVRLVGDAYREAAARPGLA